MDEQEARQALSTVREHQDRTRRAARLPWWVYLVMFVLTAGITAINDFVTLTGSKVLAGVVLVLLVVAVVTNFVGKTPPISRLRRVRARQVFDPRVFGAVVIVGGAVGWLVALYGTGFARSIADAVGLSGYPSTVFGVLCGIVFTALFAGSQALTGAANRRSVA